MTPTPESEARLRAALTWSARQMPADAPPVPLDAPLRRRPVLGVAAAIAVAGALGAGLLWLPRSGGIDRVSTEVVERAAPGSTITRAPATTVRATTVPATTVPATTVPATTIVPAAPTATYVLQPYDWIGSVAQHFGITMEQLAALNGWPDGVNHVLLAGETILVPTKPGTVETG